MPLPPARNRRICRTSLHRWPAWTRSRQMRAAFAAARLSRRRSAAASTLSRSATRHSVRSLPHRHPPLLSPPRYILYKTQKRKRRTRGRRDQQKEPAKAGFSMEKRQVVTPVLLLCDGGRLFLEELFLAVDQRIDVVGREFESVPVGDRVRWACFHAVPAKDAPRVIDVVNLRVALAG